MAFDALRLRNIIQLLGILRASPKGPSAIVLIHNSIPYGPNRVCRDPSPRN
jgi:hypothetical protein